MCVYLAEGPGRLRFSSSLPALLRAGDVDTSIDPAALHHYLSWHYRYYRSDAAPAVESGLESRTALVGFGVHSSHGHERTHLDSVRALAQLLVLYLRTPLTFQEWDERAAGPLQDFPSVSVQPSEPEPEHGPGRFG